MSKATRINRRLYRLASTLSHHKLFVKRLSVTILTILMITPIIFHIPTATAIGVCDLKKDELKTYAVNNILYYCPRTVTYGSDGTAVTCVSISQGSGDNPSKILGFLMETGYDKNAAAAIVGNLMQESGGNIDPYIRQDGGKADESWRAWNGGKTFSGGFGIAQWDYPSRVEGLQRYADSKNLPVVSLQIQLEYLVQEATQDYASGPAQLNGKSLEEATEYFMKKFENPGVPALSNRISFAQQVLGIEPSDPGFATECQDGGGDVGAGVNIDGFTVYGQCNPAWAAAPFGSNNICDAGCGPTSFAMIATALGHAVDPRTAAADAAGDYVPGSGSSWTITQHLSQKYGLRYGGDVGRSVDAINQVLSSGGMIHTSGKGGAPYTGGGHFVAIVGIKDGQWLVADSWHDNQQMGSLKSYDPYQVLSGMQNAKAVYAN